MSAEPLADNVVGVVKALYRYPVKSMAGERVDAAEVAWTGFQGDRRYAFVRAGNRSRFPWLTGRDVPDLLRYAPRFADPADPRESPVRVRTPDGRDLAVESDELLADLAAAYDAPVHLLHLGRGAYDSMPIALISAATLRSLGARLGAALDPRRFRPNILVETAEDGPAPEDGWLGATLRCGDRDDAALIRADRLDERCMMINLDPETARQDPRVLREVVRARGACAGIYGTVARPGKIRVGDAIRLAAGGSRQ